MLVTISAPPLLETMTTSNAIEEMTMQLSVTNRQTPPFWSYYRSHRNVGGWGNYLVILFVGKKIIINKVGRKGLPRWG
jgi:hypothetical protein